MEAVTLQAIGSHEQLACPLQYEGADGLDDHSLAEAVVVPVCKLTAGDGVLPS